VFIAGGKTGYRSSDVTATTEIYDPANNCFVGTGGACGAVTPPSMTNSRMGATATPLQNGKVFIFGGMGVFCFIEIYDPAKNSFVSQDGGFRYGCPESGTTATLLPDSRVFLAGGFSCGKEWGGCGGRKWTAIYDPVKNCLGGGGDLFRLVGFQQRTADCTTVSPPLMARERDGAAAALLPNGNVIIAGGTFSDFFDSSGKSGKLTEIYDPAHNCFIGTGGACGTNPPPSMKEVQLLANAAVLADGRVLIITWGNVEIYDPAKNCFVGTGGACGALPPPSMNTPRADGTVTLLPDGKVFIAGGGSAPPLATTEIFDPANNCFIGTGGACGTKPPPSMGEDRAGATATLLRNGKVFIAGGGTATTELYDPAQNCFLGANGSCRKTSATMK
jgi:hypothetical protein